LGKFKSLFFVVPLLASVQVYAEVPCQPFRLYRSAEIPLPPLLEQPTALSPEWETSLVDAIAAIEPTGNYKDNYWRWRESQSDLSSDTHRYRWLTCVLKYLKIDTDGDGSPDWSAQVDQKPSHVLFPFDSDLDGDQIENMVDPEVLSKNVNFRAPAGIAGHLLVTNPAAKPIQEKLFRTYGIIALDHTAEHSPTVLNELYNLLQKVFGPKKPAWLQHVKYVYAFKRHDGHRNVAAYHTAAKAISIGGVDVYGKNLTDKEREQLMGALAHELGHVFLLGHLDPGKFKSLGERFGWGSLFLNTQITSFYDRIFFQRHAGWQSEDLAKENAFLEPYSYVNAHEWFADAFADALVAKVKRRQALVPQRFVTWLDTHGAF
jgi:hypothetical protein